MNISLLGFNSNIDSNALISQLVNLENQSKVVPLQTKRTELTSERTAVNTLRDRLRNLTSALNINKITSDASTLVSNSATVSNKDKASVSVTGRATAQTFQLNVLQLATHSSVKSSTYVDIGVDANSDLSEVNLRESLVSGTVTINGTTASLPSLTETATVRKSASKISNALVPSDPISKANLNGVTSITEGSVTVNGISASTSGLTDIQSILDFFTSNFSGVGATLVNGAIELTGITSIGDSGDTSDLLNALGLSATNINAGNLTGTQDLSIPRPSDTLAAIGISGTVITINGTDINFDPNTDTIDSLIDTINNHPSVGVTASYDEDTGEFSLTNDTLGANPITVSSLDSNIITNFNLSDETLGTDTNFGDILDFLNNNFSGVTASLVNGKVSLTGLSSLGSAGDTSNLLSALGLKNAKITAGSATGIQNVSIPKATSTLAGIGITGTSFSINGKEISFDPNTDTINSLITKINNDSDVKAKASYDILNGTFTLKNNQTGALSIPLSSSNSNILSVFSLNSEELGNNAEFQISTLNGGETLVSNTNTVSGLIPGISLELKEVTDTAINVSVFEDSSSYKTRLDEIVKQINDVTSFARTMKNRVGKRFDSSIKALLGTAFDANDSNRYKAFVDIGFKSTLSPVDNKFSVYTIDSSVFSAALARDPNAVNKLLYGKTDTEINPFDNGASGILVQLDSLLDSYLNTTTGIFQAMNTNYDSQQKTLDSSIVRAQQSVDDYETRLVRQYAQLDSLNARMQQQQSAVASLGR